MNKSLITLALLVLPVSTFVACERQKSQPITAVASTSVVQPAPPSEPKVSLLEGDPAWIDFHDWKKWNEEGILREYSPDWNQIQANIDKAVADISDPALRSSERSRVEDKYLPQEKRNQLTRDAKAIFDQKKRDYLAAHKNDFRLIAWFSSDGLYLFPNPVMQITANAKGDDVLFYKGENGNYEENRNFLRLTAREMDGALTKFRSLKAQEIQNGADHYWALTGFGMCQAYRGQNNALEEAGIARPTAAEAEQGCNRLKQGDKKQAEGDVWKNDIVVVAHASADELNFYVDKDRPIYIADKNTGTILIDVPRAAFCFEKDTTVTVPRCEDSQTADCSEYGGSEVKKDQKCEKPRESAESDKLKEGVSQVSTSQIASPSQMRPSDSPEASIRQLLDVWDDSFKAKDAARHSDCYAPMIEKYFLRSNITHDQLRRYKEASFQNISEIRQYELHDVAIAPETAGRYSATFRKLWDTTGTDGKQFSGEEIQKLQFNIFNGEWKIVSETEPKIIHVVKGDIRR